MNILINLFALIGAIGTVIVVLWLVLAAIVVARECKTREHLEQRNKRWSEA